MKDVEKAYNEKMQVAARAAALPADPNDLWKEVDRRLVAVEDAKVQPRQMREKK
jgi:hypothetical protein